MKQALEELLKSDASDNDELKHPFIGGDKGDGADASGNVKATLRARFKQRTR